MGYQEEVIIKAIGLQDVIIEEIKYFESELKIEIFAKQIKEKCHSYVHHRTQPRA